MMDVKNLWKRINQNQPRKEKKLSYFTILFILINSILGSNLFYLPNLGVKAIGPASIIAWVALFIIAIFIMLYIAELITLHPTSGGTYEFCKRAYGKFISFMAGWLIWIAGNIGMALAIVAAAEYFIPTSIANYFILRLVFSLIWIMILNYMVLRGINAGATLLVTFGFLSVLMVIAMVLPSFLDIPTLFSGNLTTTFNSGFLSTFFVEDGWGILTHLGLALFLIGEAFFGFEVLSYMGNEVKDKRKIPKALITSMIICGVIMIVYVLGSLGTVSYHDYVTNARPWAVQALNNLGTTGQSLVVFGMYLVIVGAAAAWPITGSRLIRALAKDGLFLRNFTALHPKYNSPYKAIYFQTIVVSVFSWLIFRGYLKNWGDPYRTIYLIFVLLSLTVLSLVLFAVPILRKKEAKLKRIFKAPLPWLGPILIVSLFLILIINWIIIEGKVAWTIIKLSGSFVILGLPIYLLILTYHNQKSISKVNEMLSYFVLATEKIFFPFSIRKKIIKYLGNLKNKTILEYGCDVGSLTRRIAPKAKKVIATDLAIHKVNITNKRTKRIKNVFVHNHSKFNKLKLKADLIISIGMLSYLEHPKLILKNLSQKIKKGGKVVFLDYDKFFYLIPNVDWIESPEMLIKIFKQAGFEIKVERKKSLFWTYLLISGVRV